MTPLYNIVAKRETYYEMAIEANSQEEALAEMERRSIYEDIEEYAFDWYPLEVTDIEEEEVVD